METQRNIESREKSKEASIESRFISVMSEIKQGNMTLRNKFISDYKPFIARVISNILGKYIDTENSDEFSIGLIAFNEALECYDITRNYNFFLFCEQIIRCRVIDYLRKNNRKKEYPFSYYEDEYKINFEENYSQYNSHFSLDDVEIKEEIALLKENLSNFGISLADLVKMTPKHKDSLLLCIKIARTLSEDGNLFNYMMKNKNIPRNALKKLAKVHSKTIGNHRNFIIALCLILKSDLELSKKYLKYAEEVIR